MENNNFHCPFCRFKWRQGFITFDGSPRPEQEDAGEICPQCATWQNKIPDGEEWRHAFRKYSYRHLTKQQVTAVENWINKHFVVENVGYIKMDKFEAMLNKKL